MRTIFGSAIIFLSTYLAPAQVVESKAFMTLKCAKSPVMCMAVSPKGNVMAIGLGEYAELWDIDRGKRLHLLKHETPGGVRSVCYVSFNPDGEFVCTVDYKGKRKVWAVSSGKEDKYLKNHNEWMPAPNFVKNELGLKMSNTAFNRYYVMRQSQHPNDKDIVARSSKKSSVLFENTADRSIEQELAFPGTKDRLHLFPVYFAPDGELFVTGNDVGAVFLYRVATRSRY